MAIIVSLCKEGVDWNRISYGSCFAGNASPSVKREWIEIWKKRENANGYRSPSVKREWIEMFKDYNIPAGTSVSLCKEGVDWNNNSDINTSKRRKSPSVKREWIEIVISQYLLHQRVVSLCKEGVDWNVRIYLSSNRIKQSPSVKREWIEIIEWTIPTLSHRLPL